MLKFTSNIEPGSPLFSMCFLHGSLLRHSHAIYICSACMVTSGILFHGCKHHQLLTGNIRWGLNICALISIKIILYFLHFRTSWTKVFGTKYCKGYVIIAGIRHATPIFGEIDKVLVLDGREVLLKYTALRVIEYECHMNAYKVERGNETSVIKQTDLEDFHPVGMCKGHGCYCNGFYVVLKYNVDCLQ